MDAGVLVDEQGERRGKRRLGCRINEVNDPSACAKRAIFVISKKAKGSCVALGVCADPVSAHGALLELSSHSSCLALASPCYWQHKLPLPCPLSLQLLVAGLQILGSLMLEWHFGLAGIVYKHRALMLSPKPLES